MEICFHLPNPKITSMCQYTQPFWGWGGNWTPGPLCLHSQHHSNRATSPAMYEFLPSSEISGWRVTFWVTSSEHMYNSRGHLCRNFVIARRVESVCGSGYWLLCWFQGRVSDGNEAAHQWLESRRDQGPVQGGAADACHQRGLWAGAEENCQVCLRRGLGEVREVDGWIWICVIFVSSFISGIFAYKVWRNSLNLKKIWNFSSEKISLNRQSKAKCLELQRKAVENWDASSSGRRTRKPVGGAEGWGCAGGPAYRALANVLAYLHSLSVFPVLCSLIIKDTYVHQVRVHRHTHREQNSVSVRFINCHFENAR